MISGLVLLMTVILSFAALLGRAIFSDVLWLFVNTDPESKVVTVIVVVFGP